MRYLECPSCKGCFKIHRSGTIGRRKYKCPYCKKHDSGNKFRQTVSVIWDGVSYKAIRYV